MSFKHPEFLYLLLAILIPIIIHLFNFRRYKKLWFSNIQFLKNITTETRKQNKLKHLIILLLRVLAIICIVLAFAGPQFNRKENKSLSTNSLATFYIDNSFSMMSEGESGRLFEQSLIRAIEFAKQMPRDKQFILITNESESGRKLLSKEAFIAELDQVTVSAKNRPFSTVIRSAIKIRDEKDFVDSDMYMFSDFQSNSFDDQNFPDDSLAYYYFIPMKLLQARNIYVDSCWVNEPIILPGKSVQFKIRLINSSENDLNKIPLKVMVDGQQKAVAGVDIDAGSQEIITVNFTIYEKGWHSGLIEIEDYPIVFDDKLYFSCKVQDRINVLEINDGHNNKALQSFYETEPLFNYEAMNYRQVDYNRFKEYNLIILNSLPEISSGLISQIKDFVLSGKNLFFIPGSKQSSGYNELLGTLDAGRMASIDTSKTRVVRLNEQSEMFRDAIKNIPENADLPIVYKHFKYYYAYSTELERLVTLLNGNDFLLRKNLGKGQAYFIAVPFDNSFSNFTSNALVVPVMYNAAVQGNSTDRLFYTIGKDNLINAEISVMPAGESPFIIKQPGSGFSVIPEQRISKGKLIMDIHNGITDNGIYQLLLNDSLYGQFAFNFNRDESQMDFLDSEELKDKISQSGLVNFDVLDVGNADMMEDIKTLQKENEFWKLFIIFALLMLLAEIMILRFWK